MTQSSPARDGPAGSIWGAASSLDQEKSSRKGPDCLPNSCPHQLGGRTPLRKRGLVGSQSPSWRAGLWRLCGTGSFPGLFSLHEGVRLAHLIRFCRIRGMMQEGGPALPTKGCLRSSLAVALWAGSLTSKRSRKPFKEGEACRGRRGAEEEAPSQHGTDPASLSLLGQRSPEPGGLLPGVGSEQPVTWLRSPGSQHPQAAKSP